MEYSPNLGTFSDFSWFLAFLFTQFIHTIYPHNCDMSKNIPKCSTEHQQQLKQESLILILKLQFKDSHYT